MSFFKNKDLLELVEELASYEGLPDSEEALSERFDEYLESLEGCEECGHNHYIEQLENDPVMLSEEFSNYKDMLCTEGTIHPEQVSQYNYVGNYS